MVFTTAINLVRSRGPDKFWKKRRLFHLTAHFSGRARNCYRIAIRVAQRALAYASKSRILKKSDMRDLWNLRITAGCEEHNISVYELREGLDRMGILLNNKSLADLAIWEPRTFESIASIAQQKIITEGIDIKRKEPPAGEDLEDQPILRSQLIKKD